MRHCQCPTSRALWYATLPVRRQLFWDFHSAHITVSQSFWIAATSSMQLRVTHAMQATNKQTSQPKRQCSSRSQKMQQCISIQIYTVLKVSMQQKLVATIFHWTISNLHGSCKPLTRLVTTKTPFLHLDYSWVGISIITLIIIILWEAVDRNMFHRSIGAHWAPTSSVSVTDDDVEHIVHASATLAYDM